jgi:hypothetical protein
MDTAWTEAAASPPAGQRPAIDGLALDGGVDLDGVG